MHLFGILCVLCLFQFPSSFLFVNSETTLLESNTSESATSPVTTGTSKISDFTSTTVPPILTRTTSFSNRISNTTEQSNKVLDQTTTSKAEKSFSQSLTFRPEVTLYIQIRNGGTCCESEVRSLSNSKIDFPLENIASVRCNYCKQYKIAHMECLVPKREYHSDLKDVKSHDWECRVNGTRLVPVHYQHSGSIICNVTKHIGDLNICLDPRNCIIKIKLNVDETHSAFLHVGTVENGLAISIILLAVLLMAAAITLIFYLKRSLRQRPWSPNPL